MTQEVGRKSAIIVRTPTPPVLDGKLNDAVWEGALVIDDLHQYDPVDHGEPTEETTIFLLFDDNFLYVGARLSDSDPDQIAARQMVQEQSVEVDDFLEIVLDPFNNMRTGYLFRLNPNGIRRDGVFEQPTVLNLDWDGIWEGEAAIDSAGWTAEIAIPFRTLNFDQDNPDWGFSFARNIPRKTEKIAWSSFNRAVNPSAAGVLTGLTDLQQGIGLDVVPSVILRGIKDFSSFAEQRETDPTLDVFYNFTPSLKGVLTLNTDFSATEVDDRQVNLTRFPLFFPEKRDFFLQDLDIFSFGRLSQNGIPFFSRRIGLSASGQPVSVDGGAKLTGRAGRWNIGVLGVRQAGFCGLDESSLFVGRLAANILEESSLGVIVTDGDPQSTFDNSVAGADFRYRKSNLPSGRSVEAEAWYQRSDTAGIESEEEAWGLHMIFPNAEGLHGEFRHDRIEENFNPALGFVSRTGIQLTELQIGNNARFNRPWLRNVFTGLSVENFADSSGDLATRAILFRPFRIENNRGDQYGLLVRRDREILTDSFEISDGVVISPGEYEFDRYWIEAIRGTERTVAPRLVVQGGGFFDGDLLRISAGVDWRPNDRFFFSTNYELNEVDLPEGNFTTRLIQIRASVAFNVRWSWVNLLQYDNVSNTASINSRLRWNARAGEDLYIVWNHTSDAIGSFAGLDARRAELTVKFSRTFRF